MIYVDSVLALGKLHTICQDYVTISNTDVPYIILSDGCSSSPDTDIGARIIASQAKHLLLQHSLESLNIEFLCKDIFKQALLVVKQMHLLETALDCTLIVAYIYQDKLHYFLIGDGIVSYQINKEIIIKHFSFHEENVFYGNYFNNEYRYNLMEKSKIKPLMTTIVKNESISSDSIYLDDFIYYDSIPIESLKYFIISSDGLLSCSSDKKEAISYFNQFLDFKNLKGEFIKRRFHHWNKNINKEGIQHADDVSIAGFSFE